jgi:hypothetical protein
MLLCMLCSTGHDAWPHAGWRLWPSPPALWTVSGLRSGRNNAPATHTPGPQPACLHDSGCAAAAAAAAVWPSIKTKLFSGFGSRDALIEAMMASCHLPTYR